MSTEIEQQWTRFFATYNPNISLRYQYGVGVYVEDWGYVNNDIEVSKKGVNKMEMNDLLTHKNGDIIAERNHRPMVNPLQDYCCTICSQNHPDEGSVFERYVYDESNGIPKLLAMTLTKHYCPVEKQDYFLNDPNNTLKAVLKNRTEQKRLTQKDRDKREVTTLSTRARRAFYLILGIDTDTEGNKHTSYSQLSKVQIKALIRAARILEKESDHAELALQKKYDNEPDYVGEENEVTSSSEDGN